MDEWLFCFVAFVILALAGGFLVVAAVIHGDMVRNEALKRPSITDAQRAVDILRCYAQGAGRYGAPLAAITDVTTVLDDISRWISEHEQHAACGPAPR